MTKHSSQQQDQQALSIAQFVIGNTGAYRRVRDVLSSLTDTPVGNFTRMAQMVSTEAARRTRSQERQMNFSALGIIGGAGLAFFSGAGGAALVAASLVYGVNRSRASRASALEHQVAQDFSQAGARSPEQAQLLAATLLGKPLQLLDYLQRAQRKSAARLQ